MLTTSAHIAAIDNLSFALSFMQNAVIALFFPNMYPYNEYVLVIKNEDGYLTCIEIGHLLGLSTLYIDQSQGRYVPFPDGKTLAQMMEHPIEFNDWMKKQFPNQ